jgi:phospholipase/lecithinase/hemolysin
MKTPIAAVIVTAATLIETLAQPTNLTPPVGYPALYVFGSSWADTQNGPYYRGHWSNGPMWPEYLSTNLGLPFIQKNNFAVGGSRVEDVLGQVNSFRAPTNAPLCLYHLWGGYTDFYDTDSLTNDVLWNTRIGSRVSTLSNAVVKLYGKGARTILIPNVFDRSHDPEFVALWQKDNVSRDAYSERIRSFISAWAAALETIDSQAADLRLIRIDFHSAFDELATNFAAYAFTKAYPDALDDSALPNKSFTGAGKDYLYWDPHHCTTKAHQLFSDWFARAVSTSVLEKMALTVTGTNLSVQMGKLQIGRSYTLQSSSDLVTWRDLQTFDATAGTNEWKAALQPESTGFFRLTYHP